MMQSSCVTGSLRDGGSGVRIVQPLPIDNNVVQPCCQCYFTSACIIILYWHPFGLWNLQDIDFYILRDDFPSARSSWALKP